MQKHVGNPRFVDRSLYTPQETVSSIWSHLRLPEHALSSLTLTGTGLGLPSSFKVGHLAQSTVALSALVAALLSFVRDKASIPGVSVDVRHACAEYKSVRLYRINGQVPDSGWGPLGGLYATKDGHVRIHDSLPNHRDAALAILGLHSNAAREDVRRATREWKAVELENAGHECGAVIAALRTFQEWDALPHSKFLPEMPVSVARLAASADTTPRLSAHLIPNSSSCLAGLRVLDLTRVIAGPLSTRILAAHGADVLHITPPHLPEQPSLDADLSRGKRCVQLDLRNQTDRRTLLELVDTADVFVQSYRPGSLAALGFSPEELVQRNPRLIYASLSAYGGHSGGPWSRRRGFDSLVQTYSGMSVAEAASYGEGEVARLTTCQPLDYGAGYLLATGIMAAIYHQSREGGAWRVDVSLAGVMMYLRSLGQWEGKSGFECEDITDPEQVAMYMETIKVREGEMLAVRHPGVVEGYKVGFEGWGTRTNEAVWMSDSS